MTYFISPEYQESKAGLPEQEESDKRPVDPPHVFLKKLEGISEAFRTELLSLNEAVPAPHTSPGGALARDKWPNNITRPDLLRQAEEIWRVSRKCGLAFLGASPTALSFLARPEFRQWAALGRVILDADTEDAELCRAYFQISPYLIKNTAFNFVPAWVDQNLIIASLSSKTALAFFRSTPAFLDVDRAFNLKRWAEKARQILDTGKGCEAAAIAFIETSPRIVQKFTFKELLYWGGIGMKIAAISPDSALTYFSEPSEAMDSLYNIEIRKFLDLISALVDEALERAMDFYERCPEDLVALNPKIREQVLDVSRDLADENTGHIIDVFSEIVVSLRPLFFPMQEKVMEKGIAVSKLSLPASRAFFKGMGLVLSEIPDAFLSHWVDKGMACLSESEQTGIDYFSLISEESRSQLVKWREAVLLDDHKHAFTIFAHALSGRELKLKQIDNPASDKAAALRRYPPINDKTVYLPAFIAHEPDRLANMRLYRVKIAHQTGYMEFGTFSPIFGKILALLEAFPLKLLARDIFFFIEDGRIEFLLKREYRGLRDEIDQTVAACIKRRPMPGGDRLKEALEILLRMSLGDSDEEWISRGMRGWTHGLKKVMHGFFEKARGVWDSFEKAAELYETFSSLASEGLYVPIKPMPFHEMPNLDFFLDNNTVADVLQEIQDDETGTDQAIHMSEEDIRRLLEKMNDPKLLQDPKDDPAGEGMFIANMDGLTPMEPVERPGPGRVSKGRPPVVSPVKSARREGPFYYDEWDYIKKAYRRKWCTLWEKSVPENDLGLFHKIHDNYSDLILKVKKQFQRIRPEILEIVRRVEWGPEIDFNAMVQSVVDRKIGDSPSDQIFTRMEKKVRRISIVLLVDMSASTDRLVSLVNPTARTDRGLPEKAPQSQKAMMNSREKKIIDVEIEGLVVITEALQALGDDYAIFGFSGYGREQVDFYSIKNFEEPYSESVKSRICGIQPQKGTRMGPAIRHAAEKLKRMESDHRLLVLLSDGFPQDLNYGEDRRSKDYALHDTMMALAEAKHSGIRPFCITVDLAGDDYLRKMWDPGSYLVVKNVYSLPEVLPKVVESLVL